MSHVEQGCIGVPDLRDRDMGWVLETLNTKPEPPRPRPRHGQPRPRPRPLKLGLEAGLETEAGSRDPVDKAGTYET